MLADFKKVKITVIGLGYVGLPLAFEFCKHFPVVGYDLNSLRIKQLKSGYDKTSEIPPERFFKLRNLFFTNSKNDIHNSNVYIITVPTPVDKNNNPDLAPLCSATKLVASVIAKDDIVIFESTVFPGATEEVCVPILEKFSSLKYNEDFFCGYSPERINPGDKDNNLVNIKKIISGSNENASNFVNKLYKKIIKAGTFKASSIKIAEAAKVIENTQRDVNIALINELALIFHKLNLDTVEVLEAAGTKWNFLPFRPGLVGGHCIGVDPYYLTHKASEVGYHSEIILSGRRINDRMGEYVADCTISELARQGISPLNARILIMGLTFKENCPDTRNSKVINIYKKLQQYGCDVSITDDYVEPLEAKEQYGIDLLPFKDIENYEAVIIAVGHDIFKNIDLRQWQKIFFKKCVLIDVKSVYKKNYFQNTNIRHWRL